MLVFIRGSSAVRAPVAHVRLAAEVVGPAFGELRARDVGCEDFVHGAVVEDYVAGWLVDAGFEGARGELVGRVMSALLRKDAVAFHGREAPQTRRSWDVISENARYTDLIQTPSFPQRRSGPFTLKMVVFDIAVAVSRAPDFTLRPTVWIAPVASCGCSWV